jgi:hypothetical protein
MAIAFSRTMRSLDADDFRGPRVVWVVAAILLAAWTWWFFTAQIPATGTEPHTGGNVERTSPARLAWRAMRSSPGPAIPEDPNKQ